MIRRRVVAVLAALIAIPAAASAQVDTVRAAPRGGQEIRARLMVLPSDSVAFMIGGQVVASRDSRPVVGAQVFLAGTTIGALTDHRGRFRLDGPGAGPYELRVRLIGYAEVCVNVELAADRMSSLIVTLPPHYVGGTPRAYVGCLDPEIVEPLGP